MDADWYEDPLGRFDGRFFDGESWTNQVSDNGTLRIDDDFDGEPDDSNPFAETGDPAVEEISTSTRQGLSTSSAESPVRVVAVLDESIMSRRTATQDPIPPRPKSSSKWRWILAALLVAAAATALALFASWGDDDPALEPATLDQDQEARVEDLVEGGGTTDLDSDDMQELDDVPSAADQDGFAKDGEAPDGVDTGDADTDGDESSNSAGPGDDAPEVDRPTGAVDPETQFNDQDALTLGPLSVVNGSSLLLELSSWHRGFSLARGIELGPDAQCWLAERGGAADPNAYCGPTGPVGEDALYDVVPLSFDDGPSGTVAQPVLDAVEPDQPLPNGVVLIDAQSNSSPPPSQPDLDSGERNDEGDDS